MSLVLSEYPAPPKHDYTVLFIKARAEGLWFYCEHFPGGLWFSPDELQAKHAEGHFNFSPANWVLRDPAEGLHTLQRQLWRIEVERRNLLQRIARWKAGSAQ